MALYLSSTTAITADLFVTELKGFVEVNGWTVDLYVTNYSTSHNRLHIHKGLSHFEIYWQSTNVAFIVPCTGFNGGALPTVQPGAHSATLSITEITSGNEVVFISTSNAIYIAKMFTTATKWMIAAMGIINDKIGAWAGGMFAQGMATGTVLFAASQYNNMCINIDGTWTAVATAGGPWGSADNIEVPNNQPNYYNAGISPVPIMAGYWWATDSTKIKPLGYFPEAYKTNGGSVYIAKEIIIIGADSYIIMPYNFLVCGSKDYLFKLGN